MLVYHAVLSPSACPGRAGMYQPFTTSSRKPFLSRRSRCVRVSALLGMAWTTPRLCAECRASSELASFSFGVAIPSHPLAIAVCDYYATAASSHLTSIELYNITSIALYQLTSFPPYQHFPPLCEPERGTKPL